MMHERYNLEEILKEIKEDKAIENELPIKKGKASQQDIQKLFLQKQKRVQHD